MLSMGKMAGEVCGGALLITGVVIHKNSIRQQRREMQGMCPEGISLEEGQLEEAANL